VSHFGQGWVPLRRGIMEHVYDGRLTPVEHHALVSMLLLADAATGTWRHGSAPALTTILGYSSKNTMAEALEGLEEKGYVLRDYAPGRRGNYPIVIDKFLITRGTHGGKQIDLVATKRKYGIPVRRLDKLIRKPLLAAIAAACKNPVLSAETDAGDDRGDDAGDDRGVRSSIVSRSKNREERMSEEGGSEGSSLTPDFISGFAGEEEKTSESIFSPEYESPLPDQDAYPRPPVKHESAFSAAPTPQMSSAEQLATRFFLYQGSPRKFDTSAILELWVSTFDRLIQQYGYNDVHGAMRWSFEIDPFWPSKLIRSDDPLGYFERKLSEQIMSRYLGWKASEANKSKTQTNIKDSNNGKHQSRPSAPRAGKQAVDNSSAAEEAKRRFAERLGCQG